ncbi:MAG: hypothetical protein K2F78_01715 [Muribaculaceae bacterium]|nr:hypothetical protein [Muribaculaceae bacterium]
MRIIPVSNIRQNVNYLSDFEIELKIAGVKGDDVLSPASLDWELEFYTSSGESYTASFKNGVATNCIVGDSSITVIFDNHKMGTGQLNVKSTVYFPDARYPDGSRKQIDRGSTGVILTFENTRVNTTLEAALILPAYIRDFDRLESTYGMALDEIVSRLETVLGREPSGDVPSGVTPVGLPKIGLEVSNWGLKVLGYEPYVEAGYKPMIFRYCKWSNKPTNLDDTVRRKSNSLHAFFGGALEWRIDEDGCIYELLDAHVDKRAYTPREWLRQIIHNRIDGGVVQPELFITHGRNCYQSH